MPPELHAVLGASDSASWLACPQYLKMKKELPEAPSQYAAAGTFAHALAEFKARSYFIDPLSKRTFNSRLKKLLEDPLCEPGMDDATDLYLDTLKSYAMEFATTPVILLEQRVDYSVYAPDGFGTADCIMVGGDTVRVIDYKNGAGVPVSAEDNPQMKLYALGALELLRMIYGDTLRTVKLTIVQPHAGGVKEWETTAQELRIWGIETVRPAAQRALAGEGEAVPGEHCRFCRGKARCRARVAALLKTEQYTDRQPIRLTEAEIGDALRRGAQLVEWYNALKDYALGAILAGKDIPGWKAVEGRTTRSWTEDAFEKLAVRGIPEAVLYERKPVTVPALEKALGKKAFAQAASDLVSVARGKPALAEESDKRQAINAAMLAFGGEET